MIRGPYPIPPDAPVEGGPQSDGDRHVLVVDRDACRLYELFDAHRQGDGSWHAGSGAVFDLRSNALRPAGWTSADAAGLPILAGLVRYDEVAAGEIDHAIRITINATDASYLWPARHQAGSPDPNRAPMGLRLRLKASVDIAGYPTPAQVILRALKKYGAIVADNGSSWFISGVPDERWNNDVLHGLGGIHGSDFEAVDASSLMADPNSGRVAGAAPASPPPPATTAQPRPVARPAGAATPTTVVAPVATADTSTTVAPSTTTRPEGEARSPAAARPAQETGGINGLLVTLALAPLAAVTGATAALRRRRATPDG